MAHIARSLGADGNFRRSEKASVSTELPGGALTCIKDVLDVLRRNNAGNAPAWR
jgi:hypothetical protein